MKIHKWFLSFVLMAIVSNNFAADAATDLPDSDTTATASFEPTPEATTTEGAGAENKGSKKKSAKKKIRRKKRSKSKKGGKGKKVKVHACKMESALGEEEQNKILFGVSDSCTNAKVQTTDVVSETKK